jgi:hypothetical protein
MIRTVWEQTDIPGVYVNGGVVFDFPSADWRIVILVFAVVALVTFGRLVFT